MKRGMEVMSLRSLMLRILFDLFYSITQDIYTLSVITPLVSYDIHVQSTNCLSISINGQSIVH